MADYPSVEQSTALLHHLYSVSFALRKAPAVFIEELREAPQRKIEDALSNFNACHVICNRARLKALATFSIYRLNAKSVAPVRLEGKLGTEAEFQATLRAIFASTKRGQGAFTQTLPFELEEGMQVILSCPLSGALPVNVKKIGLKF